MKRSQGAFVRAAAIGICLALGAAAASHAQGRGGGGPPPGGGGPGGGGMGGPPGGGGMGGPQYPNGGQGPMGPGPMGGQPQSGPRRQVAGNPPRAGLEFGPPGRWWDDKSFVKSLKLRPEQQAHMDAIFEQNRDVLRTRLDSVQQAEARMEELSRSPAPDEAALFAQVDRVAQARAELEKAYTRMQLQIRKEMDPEQIKRLEKASQR